MTSFTNNKPCNQAANTQHSKTSPLSACDSEWRGRKDGEREGKGRPRGTGHKKERGREVIDGKKVFAEKGKKKRVY